MPRPRDVVCGHPAILFVGINPGATSGRVGHHFAGPGNPFWKLLHAAKLTPIELRAEEDGRLCEFNLALVNMVTRPTKTAAELSRAELRRGRAKLLAKIRAMQPAVVALVGVTLYPLLAGAAAAKVTPGPGAKPEVVRWTRSGQGARVARGLAPRVDPTPSRVEGARLFVVPNPSGLNAAFPTFAAKLPWFRKLRAFAYGSPGSGNPSATSA